MNQKIFSPRFLVICGIILFAALMRLVPHYPNFTPIAAIALFGGAHFQKRYLAFLIPLTALLLSDLFLGFHAFMLPVYASFMLVVLIGRLLQNRRRAGYIVLASVSGSVLFFLITNFAVWATTPYYPQNLGGLLTSYTAALPFFHTSLLGDLFYSTLFFGSFYLVKQRYPALKQI